MMSIPAITRHNKRYAIKFLNNIHLSVAGQVIDTTVRWQAGNKRSAVPQFPNSSVWKLRKQWNLVWEMASGLVVILEGVTSRSMDEKLSGEH